MLILKILVAIAALCFIAYGLIEKTVMRDFEKDVEKRTAEREVEEKAEAERVRAAERAEEELWPRADAEVQAINASLWAHTAARVEAEARARAYSIFRSSLPDDVASYPEASWAADKAIAFWEEAHEHERAHDHAVLRLRTYANGWAEEDLRRVSVRGDATMQSAWDEAKRKYESEEAATAWANAEAEEKGKDDAAVEAATEIQAMLGKILAKPRL
jgi:hypothetical protein